jgi:hypothetical protein
MDEIGFATDLTPLEKIYGLSVAQLSDRIPDEGRQDGQPHDSTFKSLPYIAERLGIADARLIVKADKRLRAVGRIKVEIRGGRQYRVFVLKHDATTRSRKMGSKDFYRRRGRHVEQVLFDRKLTPAQRLIGVCLTGLRYGTSLNEISGYLGIDRKTATRAMPVLIRAGHFRADGVSGRQLYIGTFWPAEKPNQRNAANDAKQMLEAVDLGHGVGHGVGHGAGHGAGHAPPVSHSNISEIAASSRNSGNSRNPPYPTDTAPIAARSEPTPAGRFADQHTWLAFEELYGLIYDCSHGKGVKTIAGITELLEGGDRTGFVSAYGTHATTDDLYAFIKAGLFFRSKQHVWPSQAGHDAYDEGFTEIDLKEAA